MSYQDILYENRNGEPHYVADYYVTIGKNGVDKFKEGDKKTPLGVYHVTDNLPRSKLADLYGSGAYPISYPNEFDKREGRGGKGIWLHGVPTDTYSRPPRASDGCIVLSMHRMNKVLSIATSAVKRSSCTSSISRVISTLMTACMRSMLRALRIAWNSGKVIEARFSGSR